MEKYKLKKDTFFFEAGTICLLTPKGNLILEDSEGTVVLRKHQLESHPELLDEWFEKIEEKKYGGRVPKRGDRYWYVSSSAQIIGTTWYGSDCDEGAFECGSAFWTEEEAERELARRKAYVILKEDTKGFKPDWENRDEKKYYVVYSYDLGIFSTGWNRQLDSGEKLYFATREDSDASIKAHEKEWKVWLGVEE